VSNVAASTAEDVEPARVFGAGIRLAPGEETLVQGRLDRRLRARAVRLLRPGLRRRR
jgi:hypothetical protein